MEANELRIGNYIILHGRMVTVGGIPNKWCLLIPGEEYAVDMELFYSIPITRELLLKCGFTENNKVFEWDNEFHTHVEFELSNSIGRDWGVHIDNCDFQTVGVGDVQFLHQLQNIYFCATGKELEVKL